VSSPRDVPPARWAQIETIVDQALDRPPNERPAFVHQACGDDEELRRTVDKWLAACDEPAFIPDAPAAVFAAPLLTTGTGIADEPPHELQQLGPYRIVRELGRGGMGAVYLAERVDGELDRQVAVKLMRRGTGDDASLRRRFRDERQILARLEHPNIASLIDGGVTPDGRLFFVMQYIAGTPIDRYCDEKALAVPEKLRLFIDVCSAVQHAHVHQVVHRDLKPGNILVTANGRAKLLDFGIAKLVEGASPSAAEQTRTGERLLTPEYASPEQIRGEPVTPASDVHALGVLLHRLLTGRRPFVRKARTPYELERAILDEEPTQPSEAVADPAERRRLRGDLDAIVLNALRKNPADRYADAGALADDLERHLKGLPVRARGRAPGYRLRRFAGRHRRIVAAAAAGMILGATALAMSSRRRERPVDALLAIGQITDYRAGADRESALPLVDMLATNLARTPGMAVVSARRMNELVRLADDRGAEAYIRAARLAGATELLSGAIYTTPTGSMRLDLQRMDVTSGTILGAHSAIGGDLFALADSTTAALTNELGLAPPAGSITDVTTRSLVAYRHYVEGLRHFQDGATAAADTAFRSALRADSTFAMAALYYARNSGYQWRFASVSAADRAEYEARYARALRLAERASDRERLMIRAYHEVFHLSLAMSAVAETLAVRYPQEIDGHLMVGISLVTEGRLREAIPYYRRILAMDSASVAAGGDLCAGCIAIDAMIEAQVLLDSMAAAEREARQWLALQPASANARSRLAQMLDGAGRHGDAMDVLLSGSFAGNTQDSVIALAKHWIRAGELETADSYLSHWMSRVDPPARGALLY
jgi:thioredoxin-like negative regulator of GroEL